MAQKIFGICQKCGGTGVCRPCRGSGRSGFFLVLSADLKPCGWCKGSANCDWCGGTGKVPTFEPYVFVQASLRTPVSISLAAFTGAGWRHIAIPDQALSLSDTELLAWVSRKVREHYQENDGKCSLFGDIVGYEFVESPHVSTHFDIEGRQVEAGGEGFMPARLSLEVGSKMVEVRRDGSLKIEPTEREQK